MNRFNHWQLLKNGILSSKITYIGLLNQYFKWYKVDRLNKIQWTNESGSHIVLLKHSEFNIHYKIIIITNINWKW